MTSADIDLLLCSTYIMWSEKTKNNFFKKWKQSWELMSYCVGSLLYCMRVILLSRLYVLLVEKFLLLVNTLSAVTRVSSSTFSSSCRSLFFSSHYTTISFKPLSVHSSSCLSDFIHPFIYIIFNNAYTARDLLEENFQVFTLFNLITI